MEDMGQDIIVQIKGFLEVPQYNPSVNKYKNPLQSQFCFDALTVWKDLPDDVHSAPTVACFREKFQKS